MLTAAVSCWVPESATTMILEYDRVIKRWPDIKRELAEERACLEALPLGVWELVAGLGRQYDLTGVGMRDIALHAMHTTLAYCHENAFQQLEELPLSLCQGDIVGNLREFVAKPCPAACVPPNNMTKIWYCGTTAFGSTVRALTLLREAPLSTGLNEKAHSHAKFLSKYHKRLGRANLQTRAVLGDVRVLYRRSAAEKQVAKLDEQLLGLVAYKRNKFSARDAFYQRLFSKVHFHSRRGANHHLSTAARKYAELSMEEKLHFSSVAAEEREKRERDDSRQSGIANNLRERCMMRLRDVGVFDEGSLTGLPNTMDACRFTRAEVLLACTLWTESCADNASTEFCDAVLEVRAPNDETIAAMEDMMKLRRSSRTILPWWVAVLIGRRDDFHRVAVGTLDTHDPFPTVIFVLQCASPGRNWGCFLRCVREWGAVDLWEVAADGHPRPDVCLPRYVPTHLCSPCHVPFDADNDESQLCIGVTYIGTLITFTDMLPIDEAIERLPPAVRARGGEPGDERERRLTKRQRDALKEEFPWLTDADFDFSTRRVQGLRERNRGDPSGTLEGALYGSDDDLVVDPNDGDIDIRDILDDLRSDATEAAVAVGDGSYGVHFFVRSRGMLETYGLFSAAMDESFGCYSRVHCDAFVRKFHAPATKTFNERQHRRDGSFLLAKEWARKLEHYYSSWAATGYADPCDLSGPAYDYHEHFAFTEWANSAEAQRRSGAAIDALRSWTPR